MTIADQIRDHQARSQPHVLRLRMLARGEAGVGLPRRVILEVVRATHAIIDEAETAGRAAQAAVAGGREVETGTFLRVRLNRLAAAADEAIAAARGGDAAVLRRHLHRFDALTSAVWAVQHAVYGHAPRRSVGDTSRRLPAAAPAAP